MERKKGIKITNEKIFVYIHMCCIHEHHQFVIPLSHYTTLPIWANVKKRQRALERLYKALEIMIKKTVLRK